MIAIVAIVLFLGCAWLISTDRKAISFRTVSAAFLLQLAFAAFALYLPAGQQVMGWMASGVQSIIEYSNAGIGFLFGKLGSPGTVLGTSVTMNEAGNMVVGEDISIGFVFLFHVLPVIIFMSALMGVLYHLKIMQWIAWGIGGLIAKVTAASKIESLSAATNIFVSQTEAPVVIRPYLASMKDDQFFSLMVVGMASVAGSVLVGYAAMGIPLEFLIAAAFMSAPGGLLMAKMVMPAKTDEEIDDVDILNIEITDAEGKKPTNVIEAAAEGAAVGLKLVGNIGAMLLAFVAIIALMNGLLGGVGGWFGYSDLTFEGILGTIFSPLMYIMGVPWEETVAAGNLVGQKLILNEFVAFSNMLDVLDELSPHTIAVVTFALCGFANLSSLAIQLGGFGALAPHRRTFIAKNGLKALAAGTLSNFMSAALASVMLSL